MENQKSSIEEVLANNSDPETLIRLRAVDKTIEFLKDRQFQKFEAFNEVFEFIYNNIKGLENKKQNERI